MTLTMKNLKKANGCQYPNCQSKDFIRMEMPVGKMTESGQIIFPEGDVCLTSICLLCEYHALLAEKGIAQLVDRSGMVILIAPHNVIDLIEKMFAILLKKTKKNGKKKTQKVRRL